MSEGLFGFRANLTKYKHPVLRRLLQLFLQCIRNLLDKLFHDEHNPLGGPFLQCKSSYPPPFFTDSTEKISVIG